MAEIARLSTTHEMLMNWLILNPEKTLRECADHFGYTQSWVSQLIHSDIFQHALREKQERVAIRVAESIPEKLARAADVAVEKLSEHIEKSEDPEFLLSATDKLLHRMGFAPQSARNPAGPPGRPTTQQNNFFLTAGDLESARALMQESAAAQAAALELVLPPAPEGDTYDM